MTHTGRWGALAGLLLLLIGATAASSRTAVTSAAGSSVSFYAVMLGMNIAGIHKGDPNGVGTAAVTVTLSQSQFCYSIAVRNIVLPATAAHLHNAVRGKYGPVVLILNRPDINGLSSGCGTLSQSTLMSITAQPSQYFIDVHNVPYPEGAVRGQVTPVLPPAHLAVHPSSGTVGQTVALSGTAFGQSEPVTVTWDSATVLTTTTDSPTNTFRVTVPVPASSVGVHTIAAVGAISGRTASATFRVHAAPAQAGSATLRAPALSGATRPRTLTGRALNRTRAGADLAWRPRAGGEARAMVLTSRALPRSGSRIVHVSIVDGPIYPTDYKFVPRAITIARGTTVVWTNRGMMHHTVTQRRTSNPTPEGFDSGDLAPGAAFTMTFTMARTYSYYCQIHPVMKGTVTVR